uniref:Uncharacterized protein n=1 Tax=Arundo donax TaxID=35708 RepID=A0A0A9DNY2_ARUDO
MQCSAEFPSFLRSKLQILEKTL